MPPAAPPAEPHPSSLGWNRPDDLRDVLARAASFVGSPLTQGQGQAVSPPESRTRPSSSASAVSAQVGQLRGARCVGRKEHDELLLVVVGGGEFDVVEVEPSGVGVAESFA
jgi:hypothetical protein